MQKVGIMIKKLLKTFTYAVLVGFGASIVLSVIALSAIYLLLYFHEIFISWGFSNVISTLLATTVYAWVFGTIIALLALTDKKPDTDENVS